MSAEPRTLAEVGRLVASKGLTSEAVTERCLERITEQNRTLNAFVSVLDDDAVAQAKKADQEIAAGRYRGPLHGIPISLKDIIDLRNAPTTAASRVRDGHIARRDATVVGRLRARPALRPAASEVERILHVPLRELADPDGFREEWWGERELERAIYFFELEDETIWGATARMLVDLLSIVLGVRG